MSKLLSSVVLGVAVLAMCGAPLQAANSLTEQQRAQNKLLAQRAARADAIRKLAERIKGLHITSETLVKDFVTESDTIRTALDAMLSGMKEDSVKYMDDGTCAVTMTVTLQEVITDLVRIRNAYYHGDKYKVQDFEKMTVTNTVKDITETGTGAPRAEVPQGETVVLKEGDTSDTVSGPPFWTAHVMPQGRLGAVRAAHADALRKLAERIKGTLVSSNTVVRDFVTESDFIKLSMSTFLRGAKEVAVRYHPDELIVEVEMQVKLRTVLADIKSYVSEKYKGDSAKIRSFEEVTLHAEDTIIKETGMGVPNPKYLKDVPAGDTSMLPPDWVTKTVSATGSAAMDMENPNKAQAKLMAFRGAELDARRKLAEEINGLVISSKTKVQDFVTQSDKIRTAVLAFQQGARVVEGSQKLADDGTATVTVEIDLAPLWDTIMIEKKSLSIKSSDGTSIEKSSEKVIVKPAAQD